MKDHVYTRGAGTSELRPVLKMWARLVKRYSRETEADAAFWYTERANVGVFAAAAWSLGGIALEEWKEKKRAGAESRNGRVDLYFSVDATECRAEAKLVWEGALVEQRRDDGRRGAVDEALRAERGEHRALLLWGECPRRPRRSRRGARRAPAVQRRARHAECLARGRRARLGREFHGGLHEILPSDGGSSGIPKNSETSLWISLIASARAKRCSRRRFSRSNSATCFASGFGGYHLGENGEHSHLLPAMSMKWLMEEYPRHLAGGHAMFREASDRVCEIPDATLKRWMPNVHTVVGRSDRLGQSAASASTTEAREPNVS